MCVSRVGACAVCCGTGAAAPGWQPAPRMRPAMSMAAARRTRVHALACTRTAQDAHTCTHTRTHTRTHTHTHAHAHAHAPLERRVGLRRRPQRAVLGQPVGVQRVLERPDHAGERGRLLQDPAHEPRGRRLAARACVCEVRVKCVCGVGGGCRRSCRTRVPLVRCARVRVWLQRGESGVQAVRAHGPFLGTVGAGTASARAGEPPTHPHRTTARAHP